MILQAHEALYLPSTNFIIFYSPELREHGVAVNDAAKLHGCLQNILVDNIDIPLTLQRGLLQSPIRVPTDEDLL